MKSREALLEAVNALLGKQLVTYQNAPDGQMVSRLLIEETLPIARELYLSLTLDRVSERIVLIASGSGGMEIEEIGRKTPEKILRETCDPLWAAGLPAARWLSAWGWKHADRRTREAGRQPLYKLFKERRFR